MQITRTKAHVRNWPAYTPCLYPSDPRTYLLPHHPAAIPSLELQAITVGVLPCPVKIVHSTGWSSSHGLITRAPMAEVLGMRGAVDFSRQCLGKSAYSSAPSLVQRR